jgi:hypothetical protein
LLYASRWSSTEKASEFAAIYARALAQRYKKVEEAVPTSSSESAAQDSEPKATSLKGRHVWTTEEGTVLIEEKGDTVMVSESLDSVTTEALEREVFAAAK